MDSNETINKLLTACESLMDRARAVALTIERNTELFRNASDAFQAVLRRIVDDGSVIENKGIFQKELLSTLTHIERPDERFIVIPGRNNNVFAQVAESLWVISGRNDLEFLSNFLPRAKNFSDDGETWRAGYGPRLRMWRGEVDQLEEVHRLIRSFPNNKRAVVSLFDPCSDFIQSKDIPCNNWIQFVHRDGYLHMNIAIRSNDLFWGFSGINSFEWSVLQQTLAESLSYRTGSVFWFVGAFQVYERHFRLAANLLKRGYVQSMYEFDVSPTPIKVQLTRLDEELSNFFMAERFSRAGKFIQSREIEDQISDIFIRNAARMMRLFNAYKRQEDLRLLVAFLQEIECDDLLIAAAEFIFRSNKGFIGDLYLSVESREFLSYLELI